MCRVDVLSDMNNGKDTLCCEVMMKYPLQQSQHYRPTRRNNEREKKSLPAHSYSNIVPDLIPHSPWA